MAQTLLDTLLSKTSTTGAGPSAPTTIAPTTAGFSDIGDAMRLITQNPIEFAVPAMLGIPLEQVLLGAIERQKRTKQRTLNEAEFEGVATKPKKDEPTILQDILEADSKDNAFMSMLLSAFGIGG